MVDVEDITREFYGRLFLLPTLPKLVVLYAALLAGIGVINALPSTSLYDIALSVEQYVVLGLTLVTVFMFLSATKVFTLKRVVGLSAAMFIASLPAELIFYRLTGLKGTGLLAGTGLVYVVLSAFYGVFISLVIASVPPFAAFWFVNSLLGKGVSGSVLAAALITEMISLLAGIAYLAYFEKRGRVSGYSPMRMLRAFLRTWFTGDPKVLEGELARNAVTSDLRVRALVFWREGAEPVMLVFPSLHYGPFRDVGSARFIYHLEEVVEPSFKLFTFHTAGSHEHNLVSSDDSRLIAKLVGEALLAEVPRKVAKLRMCPPYRVRLSDEWESFTLNGPTALIPIIVNKVKGNDDLPPELWDKLIKDERSPPFTAVADSHSFKGDKVTDLNVLEPLINEVLNRYSCSEGEDFLVGYGEAMLDGWCRCVCNQRVKALTLKFGNARYALVYVYGNNMDGAYRLKLEDTVRKLGVNDVEIVTPDDHSCAASFKEAPYDVVSECPPLTEAVVKAVEEAIRAEVPATYSTYDVIVSDVKFVGNGIFELTNQLGRLGRKAEYLILLLLLVSNAAPIVVYTSVLMR